MCVTDSDSPTKTLLQNEADVILEALTTRAFEGIPLEQAFDATGGMSVETFYRRRAEFPQAIAEIQTQADSKARELKMSMLAEHSASQLRKVLASQSGAADAFLGGLDRLAKIARGDPEEYVAKDGTPRSRTPYARDSIAAMQMLWNAMGTPEGMATGPAPEKERPALPPPMFPGLNFTRVQATAVDGTTVTVEREPIEEGEVTVLPQNDQALAES